MLDPQVDSTQEAINEIPVTQIPPISDWNCQVMAEISHLVLAINIEAEALSIEYFEPYIIALLPDPGHYRKI